MRPTEEGFTLVEVMIAMVVLAVALLELGRMQIAAIQVNAAATRLTRGTTIAQDRVEQLMALPFNDDTLRDDDPAVGQTTSHSDPNPPQGYTVTWEVDRDTPAAGTMTVTVTVSWRNLGKTPKEFHLAFFKSAV
jgi:prepilin-type N-terminal cleavage/methylation domain-containing protein